MALNFDLQTYEPPGPVGAAFIDSTHPISIIMGPGGSGKTVGSAFKGPHLASIWYPVCKDGVIRVKTTIIRDTYRNLALTALESWQGLFPEKHPWTDSYEGGQDRPVVHKLRWSTMRDKTLVPVEYTAQFAAVGDANPEQFAKGFETSLVWDNECDMTGDRIPGLMYSRTGRYPPVSQIAPSELDRVMKPFIHIMRAAGIKLEDGDVVLPRMLWGDCNPPDPSNWVNTMLVEEPEKWPLYKLFRQPSGLSPQAENRKGKPRSAYEEDLRTMTPNDARRYVHGEIGYALDGKPVYDGDFSTNVHRSSDFLDPAPGLPIALGFDAGGSPACGIGQFMPNGQMRMLHEVCADPGTGPSRFSEMVFEVLLSRFAGFAVREAFGDPSSWFGADKVAGELAWIETVARALNINIEPAPSQETSLRQDAVRFYLTRPIDSHTPRLLIDPRCKRTIAGFAAHYKLSKRSTAGATDRIVVHDNEYTHIHDAWQYLCLGHRGRQGVIKDAANMGRAGNVVPIAKHFAPKSTFNVWNV
jgi:hypothetical protein